MICVNVAANTASSWLAFFDKATLIPKQFNPKRAQNMKIFQESRKIVFI